MAVRDVLRRTSFSVLICLVGLIGCLAAQAADGNRYTYLDTNDPYYVSRHVARLTTPQWVGEPGVEAVVVLAIDDMRGHEKWETFLRPIIERLKRIDGRAGLSIMTCQIPPNDPHLQTWMAEGLSLECHTFDHPCPLLKEGNFSQSVGTYNRCVDLLNSVPNNHPIAFRMPCCDSQNTVSPRFFSEIFNSTTPRGNFLTLDSSVFQLLTPGDSDLPRELVLNDDGSNRFRAYLPFTSFVNTVEDYPYPYLIGGRCWEFPCIVPSDWEAQNIWKPANPRMLTDMLAALDAVVIKHGVFNLVFHPYGWISNQQVVEFIDRAHTRYGSKVKFLNFREAQERLNANLLAGEPLRDSHGDDNGVRLLDLNHDGYMDVVVGNDRQRRTRVWSADSGTWRETEFPAPIAAARFGVIEGQPVVVSLAEQRRDAWRFDGSQWVAASMFADLPELNGTPICTAIDGRDRGLRLIDLDADGTCELLFANDKQRAVFRWSPDPVESATSLNGSWQLLPAALPSAARFVDAGGRDGGLRFVDLDDDLDLDLLYSDEHEYGLFLFQSLDTDWRQVFAAHREQGNQLPPFVRAGTDMGAWFHSRHIWWQNEDTSRLPDLVDRRSFNELLEGVTPEPKSPAASLKALAVRPGFKVELVATEPLVADPISFDWGPDGRLWVVEMGDYPTGVNRQPGGQVRCLEDSDGDGRYDRSTVFLDGLRYPTSVMTWRRGVLVTAVPELIYAEDTDGDGRADHRETLFSGFHTGNPQHLVNGLTWGLDNWIYGANGDSGGRIKSLKTGQETSISGRDFRLRPDDGAFEDIEGFSQFNRNRDDWGNWFGCSNNNPMWQYVLSDHYLRRNPHVAPPDGKRDVSDHPGAAPIYPRSRLAERFNDPHTANHFTSACSTMVYRDHLLGASFADNVFICEPVHNLVHREVMTRDGLEFTSHRPVDERRSEFLASTDNWFRPTAVRTGPDGALWVADMYRAVIEHPEWIPTSVQKRLDLRAGSDQGRIYRIVPINGTPRPFVNLAQLPTADLPSQLRSPNGWVRDKVQQLLVERGGSDAVATLESLATVDGEPPTARLHALCTLDGLGQLRPEVLVRGLHDPAGGVRRHAVRISESHFDQPGVGDAVVRLTPDTDPQVRLQLGYSLGEWKSPVAGQALGKLLIASVTEPWIAAAALSSVPPHLDTVVETIVATVVAETQSAAGLADLMANLLAMSAAMGKEDTIVKLVPVISRSDQGHFARWQMTALADLLDLLDRQKKTLAAFREGATPDLQREIDRLAAVFSAARGVAMDASREDADRIASIRLLGRGISDQEADLELLRGLLSPDTTESIRIAAINALGHLDNDQVAGIVLSGWRGYGPEIRSQVLDLLFSRERRLAACLDAIEAGSIQASELDASRRQLLLTHRTKEIRERAAKLFANTGNQDRQKVIASYLAATQIQGDRSRGEQLFHKHCAVCHRIGDRGHAIGPDLTALTNKSPEAMLTALLDPSRAIEAKFINYTAVTNNGLTFSGLLAEETGNSITLVAQEGKQQTVLRSDLEALESTGKSLMPEGFEKDLLPTDVADVLTFLRGNEAKPKELPGNHPEVVQPERLRGYIFCLPSNAEVYGHSLRIEEAHGNLGWWAGADDHAVWTIEIARDLTYAVYLDLACDKDSAGNHWLLEVGDQRLIGKVESTGDWNTYRRTRVGEVHLKSGRYRLGLRPNGNLSSPMFDLRSITLIPAGRLAR